MVLVSQSYSTGHAGWSSSTFSIGVFALLHVELGLSGVESVLTAITALLLDGLTKCIR